MILSLLVTATICLSAGSIGQAVLRLCGARQWTWLSFATGFSVMMLITVPALYVPGRGLTTFVVLALATIASLWIVVRDRALWPPAMGLLASIPILLLALIPFAAAGRSGILGVMLNNDMSGHLIAAESYRSAVINEIFGLTNYYPVGPHSLVASLTEGLGVSSEFTFTGLAIALPVMLGWTGLHALTTTRRWAPFPVALIVGMPFMVAAYYGQGAFKECLMAMLVLASAVMLARPLVLPRPTRWLPYALIVSGTLSSYSATGAVWPALFICGWAIVRLGSVAIKRRSPQPALQAVRANLLPAVIAIGGLVLVMIPQIPRMQRFIDYERSSSLLSPESLGNLAGPLPFREVLGVWDSVSFRVAGPGSPWVILGMIIVISAIVIGLGWALGRHEWMIPLATGISAALWAWSNHTQSPYIAAKILMVLAPLVMLIAVRPLVEEWGHRTGMRAWQPIAASLLVAVQLVSTVNVLRTSPVGSLERVGEIRQLLPRIDGRPTLYLGNDDFTNWEFGATRIKSPVIGFPVLPFRIEKPWAYGLNSDVDSLPSAELNHFNFIVAPRDPAASQIPGAFRLIANTPNLDLYERKHMVAPRRVLPGEAGGAGVRLDCGSSLGRRVLRGGGVASLRPPTVTTRGAAILPGETAVINVPLGPGTWALSTDYVGPLPVSVSAQGLHVTLPPNQSRPGPRWPVGTIRVPARETVAVRMSPTRGWLTPVNPYVGTSIQSVVAVRTGPRQIVPVRAACGKYVDWYRPASWQADQDRWR